MVPTQHLPMGGRHAGREDRHRVGQGDVAASAPEPGRRSEDGNLIEAKGTLLGVIATDTATYWSMVRPDGTLYGEGQGIIMGKNGEMATWVGQGVGTIKTNGSVSFRGAVYYQTSAPAWSRLNSVAGVFEYQVDTKGKTRSTLWEWK